MTTIIRRGQEADLPALRDILNHYILNTVVTFEMVEMSLENRKTWFTQFREDGRYQLMVAEKNNKVVGYAASLRFHQRPAYAPSVMTSIYIHPNHLGQGIGEGGLFCPLGKFKGRTGSTPGLWVGGFAQCGLCQATRKIRVPTSRLAQRRRIQIWKVSRCSDLRTSIEIRT